METIKIKDIDTGAVKEVKKSLASDYIGTGKFVVYKEETKKTKPDFKFNINKEEKND